MGNYLMDKFFFVYLCVRPTLWRVTSCLDEHSTVLQILPALLQLTRANCNILGVVIFHYIT